MRFHIGIIRFLGLLSPDTGNPHTTNQIKSFSPVHIGTQANSVIENSQINTHIRFILFLPSQFTIFQSTDINTIFLLLLRGAFRYLIVQHGPGIT